MVPTLFFYQLVLIALVWLCLMCHGMWPSAPAPCLPTPEPTPPVPKRKRERKPLAGLTTKPPCDTCEHGTAPRPPAPSTPPPRIVPTRAPSPDHVLPRHTCMKELTSLRGDCAFDGM